MTEKCCQHFSKKCHQTFFKAQPLLIMAEETEAVEITPAEQKRDTLKTDDVIISMQSVHVSQEITALSAFSVANSSYSVDQVIDHLKECAEDGDHIDIYQITAFRSKNVDNNVTYYQIMFKAILAVFTQLIGMFVVLWQEVNQGWEIKDHWCDADDPIHFRVMSFLFCLTIIVFSYEGFVTFRYNGMYRIHHLTFENMPGIILIKFFVSISDSNSGCVNLQK